MNLMEKYRSKIEGTNSKGVALSQQDGAARNTVIRPEANKTLADHARATREAPDGPCPVCRTWTWWKSIYGAIVCGYCHPPADQYLIRKWIQQSKEQNNISGR